MAKQKTQVKKPPTLPSAVIFLGCSLFAIVCMFITGKLIHSIASNNDPLFEEDFRLLFSDLFILVLAIAVARKLSQKAKLPISHNKESTFKHDSTLYIGILGAGILIGIGIWVLSGKSAIRSVFPPIMISSVVQIVLFLVASDFVFTSKDPTRKKVWAPIIAVLLLIIPSVIFYAFSQ